MAVTLQSFRFCGLAVSGPVSGSFEALNHILADLCTSGNPKKGTSLALKKHVEEEARDLSREAFSRFMDQLYDRILSLLESNDVAQNMGALRAIDELIDIALGENASKEMAENASTIVNVHVPKFVDVIWVTLSDPTLAIRERAVEPLRACLRAIEKRIIECLRLCKMDWEKCSYSQNTGEFMMSRYREVAKVVLRYLEHRDRLPCIAHFLHDRFVINYLTICMNHILTALRIPAERAFSHLLTFLTHWYPKVMFFSGVCGKSIAKGLFYSGVCGESAAKGLFYSGVCGKSALKVMFFWDICGKSTAKGLFYSSVYGKSAAKGHVL
ncbi:hypothetical protein J1N35_007519 [Gossypium stocksii]|uniref:Uncharacterized protein n=1 Tax=Gossypium stocksii TaxID=47602 RepID=A0A9D3W6T2_9ROSI|nr:hypothetical protein J1N35_007519 [Gossypium stocksii]